ncbi:MAG TPA: NAD-dependent epimerase/dehydratase family protein, partial [Polyangiales bacterium]|nr:NAD-dependent epimerase/dehydratase family protein [Polyangiales bacterium]
RDEALIAGLCKERRFDGIVHLAALAGVRASIGQAKLYYDVNVNGTINLLDGARDTGVKSFVFASTSSVYGETDPVGNVAAGTPPTAFVETEKCDRPLAPYPASKRSCELLGFAYHNVHQLSFTALRFFTVYGPRNRPDMMAFKLLESITRGKQVPLYNGGNMRRDWTYVKDIAAGVVAAVDRPLGYEQINLGRGEPVVLLDFVRKLEALTGGKASTNDEPMPAADVSFTYADIGKARKLLGYAPQTSVDDGVRELWKWYEAQSGNR